MARKSSVEKNKNREKLVAMHAVKRLRLKAMVRDKELPIEERFSAGLKLSEMPRNGARIRLRNRCEVTGRPRGYYRKFKMSRIALRDLGSTGQVPGLVKSSW
jgi:small subunit ribosomal protein S14